MRVLSRHVAVLLLISGGLLFCATEVRAQCASARWLGGAENPRRHPRIKIQTGAFPNDGNELGSIWAAGAPVFNSGGPHFETEDRCSATGASGWWKSGTKFLGEYSGIQTFIASPTCLLTNCPPRDSAMMTVLEDQSTDGSDAAFIAYLVDPTPGGRRWWDHARTEPMRKGGVTEHLLKAYPVPTLKVETMSGQKPRLKVALEDFKGHAHVVRGEENQRQSEGQAIVSLDLVAGNGQQEPGRKRQAWKAAGSLAFSDAGENTIPLREELCSGSVEPLWLAVGVTFVDGIESRLVGRALKVDCSNPRVAE